MPEGKNKMLVIRKMREEDIKPAAELEARIFPDPWSERAIRETWEQKQTFILTAFEDSKLIGYLILYYVLEEGEIARIAVAPEYRCMGVGSRMLLEMEILCENDGISKLLLDVRESNEKARAFYEEHGFLIDGIRRNFYDDPVEDAILMSCAFKNKPTS